MFIRYHFDILFDGFNLSQTILKAKIRSILEKLKFDTRFFFKFFEKLKENNLGALLAYATKNNIVTALALFKNEKPTFFGKNHQKNR